MGANFAHLTGDFHVSLFCYKKGLHAVSDIDKADAGRVERKSAFKHAQLECTGSDHPAHAQSIIRTSTFIN